MSKNINQIFVSNPATTMNSTDLLYLGRSPYDATDDFAITFANFVSSIGTATPTASTIAKYDANKNLSANNFIPGYLSTASAAGTTTLTAASAEEQYVTGSTTQTIVLPVTSTLATGFYFLIYNNSSGNITVNASDASLVQLMSPGTSMKVTCISTGVTTNSAWDVQFALNTLSPNASAIGITSTGGDPQSYYYSSSYQTVLYNNVTYQNKLSVTFFGEPSIGVTTIDFGNTSIISNFSVIWSALTTVTMTNMLIFTGTLAISSAPLLTTITVPNLVLLTGALTLGNTAIINGNVNSLTTFSAPNLYLITGIAINAATSLATISLPNLLNLVTTVGGTAPALTTFTLTNLLRITGAWTLTANALTTLSMPALTTLDAAFTPVGTSLATLSMPNLVTIGGAFSPTLAALTTLTLTNLVTITGAFGLVAATLTTLALPALTTLSGGFGVTCALATTVTLTSLATVTGTVASSFAALATLSMPALVTVTSTFALTAANLVTFSMGATLKNIGGNFTMTGMKLNQASVDSILVSLAALDGTGGTTAYSSKTINLSGGTSSAPSATGLAAKVTLVARSCTVTTN